MSSGLGPAFPSLVCGFRSFWGFLLVEMQLLAALSVTTMEYSNFFFPVVPKKVIAWSFVGSGWLW